MTRVPFSDLFVRRPDGRWSARVPLRIGQIRLGPDDAPVDPETLALNGESFADLVGKYLEVTVESGVHVVHGYY